MKNYILLLIAVAAVSACHKSGPPAVNSDRTAPIIKSRHWSGYYYDTTYYMPGSGHYRSIADSVLAIQKVDDTTLGMTGLDTKIKYRATYWVAGTITFKTDYTNLNMVSLTYYYAADSVVYSWESDNPTEMTLIQYEVLSSHK